MSTKADSSVSKRCFDVVVSFSVLLIFLPVLMLLAFSVWLLYGRPVLFRQIRVGMAGGDFFLYKFRTMTTTPDSESNSFDAGETARVTTIGRILRVTKLDELPQLWNVLKGDMSLVGPRPEVRKWVEVYPERWAVAHSVRPGITDLASIVYRNEEKILARSGDPEKTYRDEILPRKLDLYEEYVKTRSFFRDLKIIWQTVVAVLCRY